MLSKSLLVFGLGFIPYNVGIILSYYVELGFNVESVGGLIAVLGLMGVIYSIGFKDFFGLLMCLTTVCFIASSSLHVQSLPYSKEFNIAGLVFFGLTMIKYYSMEGFTISIKPMLKHPFLSHPSLKITVALSVLMAMFKVMHWDYREFIDQAIHFSFVVWAIMMFILLFFQSQKSLIFFQLMEAS